jgi:hypothetical protein
MTNTVSLIKAIKAGKATKATNAISEAQKSEDIFTINSKEVVSELAERMRTLSEDSDADIFASDYDLSIDDLKKLADELNAAQTENRPANIPAASREIISDTMQEAIDVAESHLYDIEIAPKAKKHIKLFKSEIKKLSVAKVVPLIKLVKVAKATKASENISKAQRAQNLSSFMEGSKAVDAKGKPLTLYTGTSKDKDFTTFNVPENGAWFTESADEASSYAKENDSQSVKFDPSTRQFKDVNTASRVIPVHINVQNVYELTDEDVKSYKYVENYKAWQKNFFSKLRMQGYDGAKFPGGVWVVLKDPSQIKSTLGNTGEFSRMNKSMIKGAAGAALIPLLRQQNDTGTEATQVHTDDR